MQQQGVSTSKQNWIPHPPITIKWKWEQMSNCSRLFIILKQLMFFIFLCKPTLS